MGRDEEEFSASLRGAQRGDEAAWAALYHEYAGSLRGYLIAKGAREPDDLLGEVFVDLARRIHAFSGTEAQFRSWIFMVAHHRIIDERRLLARRPVDPTAFDGADVTRATDDVENEALRRLMAGDALAVIDSLTPDQRAVLRMRLVDGFTVDEIASRLDKPAGAIKALQRRGLAAAARAHVDHPGVSR